MGLKLLDGTIVDSSFTPMCFILIMANISRLLCMEVGMHKQVLDFFAQQNFSRSFWWPPTLFTWSGWYHLHCHFGSVAARWHRKHTLWSWGQTQPEFNWPFPIIVKDIFTDFRTLKTVVNCSPLIFSIKALSVGQQGQSRLDRVSSQVEDGFLPWRWSMLSPFLAWRCGWREWRDEGMAR